MDVGLNTDRMLAYFDTSAHDDQTLREIHNKQPAPEFLKWAQSLGIFEINNGAVTRGPAWGDARQFCSSEAEFRDLLAATPAMHGFDSAGPRPANRVTRAVKMHQGVGREAIRAELRVEELQKITPMRVVRTEAASKEAHLNSPDAGARLSAEAKRMLKPESARVQIVISDGLSAEAVHHNMKDLLPVLLDGLEAHGIGTGKPILVPYGRVKLAEPIADAVNAELIVYLIGERPGGDALASRSLSAYFVYQLKDAEARRTAAQFSGNAAIRFEYSVISNIYSGGLPPAEAGAVIVEKVGDILTHKAAGNRLEALLKTTAQVG
jgi:ethanolamine ammonia-lyase large subunit